MITPLLLVWLMRAKFEFICRCQMKIVMVWLECTVERDQIASEDVPDGVEVDK